MAPAEESLAPGWDVGAVTTRRWEPPSRVSLMGPLSGSIDPDGPGMVKRRRAPGRFYPGSAVSSGGAFWCGIWCESIVMPPAGHRLHQKGDDGRAAEVGEVAALGIAQPSAATVIERMPTNAPAMAQRGGREGRGGGSRDEGLGDHRSRGWWRPRQKPSAAGFLLSAPTTRARCPSQRFFYWINASESRSGASERPTNPGLRAKAP